MKTVGVSASTGMGMEQLFKAIDECKEEYYEFYAKELEQRAKASPLPIQVQPWILEAGLEVELEKETLQNA